MYVVGIVVRTSNSRRPMRIMQRMFLWPAAASPVSFSTVFVEPKRSYFPLFHDSYLWISPCRRVCDAQYGAKECVLSVWRQRCVTFEAHAAIAPVHPLLSLPPPSVYYNLLPRVACSLQRPYCVNRTYDPGLDEKSALIPACPYAFDYHRQKR